MRGTRKPALQGTKHAPKQEGIAYLSFGKEEHFTTPGSPGSDSRSDFRLKSEALWESIMRMPECAGMVPAIWGDGKILRLKR
jgi:hypothetical protein